MPRSTKRERGSNLVEAALLVPLLLLLLAGVADLGRAYFTYITLLNAAREGARFAVDNPTNSAGIIAATQSEAQDNGFLTIPASAVDVQPANPSSGNPVTVVVRLNYTPVLGGVLDVASFPIQAQATFRVR